MTEGWTTKPGTVLDERYRLIDEIGRGAMGVIYRAEHLRMGREVAVKLIHPQRGLQSEDRARFEREVAAVSRLNHPNIVQCFDSGMTPDGSLYLVMELLHGRTLRQAITADGRFWLGRATEISLQLLDGLGLAHREGLIHRDLKPDNIFLVRDARGREVPKILDFGLAKSISDPKLSELTATGIILGTPAYLAPEAMLEKVSYPADVYAMGLIMLELVVGRKAFGNFKESAITIVQMLTAPIEIPERLRNTPYGRLIEKCVQKHPDDRPPSADVAYRILADAPSPKDFVLHRDEIPPLPARGDASLVIAASQQGREFLRKLPGPQVYHPMAQFSAVSSSNISTMPEDLADTTIDPDLREQVRQSGGQPVPTWVPPQNTAPPIGEMEPTEPLTLAYDPTEYRRANAPKPEPRSAGAGKLVAAGLMGLGAVVVVAMVLSGSNDAGPTPGAGETAAVTPDAGEADAAKAGDGPTKRTKSKQKPKPDDDWTPTEAPVIDDGYVPQGSTPGDIRLAPPRD